MSIRDARENGNAIQPAEFREDSSGGEHCPAFPLTLPQRDIWFDQLRHSAGGNTALYNIGG